MLKRSFLCLLLSTLLIANGVPAQTIRTGQSRRQLSEQVDHQLSDLGNRRSDEAFFRKKI